MEGGGCGLIVFLGFYLFIIIIIIIIFVNLLILIFFNIHVAPSHCLRGRHVIS